MNAHSFAVPVDVGGRDVAPDPVLQNGGRCAALAPGPATGFTGRYLLGRVHRLRSPGGDDSFGYFG